MGFPAGTVMQPSPSSQQCLKQSLKPPANGAEAPTQPRLAQLDLTRWPSSHQQDRSFEVIWLLNSNEGVRSLGGGVRAANSEAGGNISQLTPWQMKT